LTLGREPLAAAPSIAVEARCWAVAARRLWVGRGVALIVAANSSGRVDSPAQEIGLDWQVYFYDGPFNSDVRSLVPPAWQQQNCANETLQNPAVAPQAWLVNIGCAAIVSAESLVAGPVIGRSYAQDFYNLQRVIRLSTDIC